MGASELVRMLPLPLNLPVDIFVPPRLQLDESHLQTVLAMLFSLLIAIVTIPATLAAANIPSLPTGWSYMGCMLEGTDESFRLLYNDDCKWRIARPTRAHMGIEAD